MAYLGSIVFRGRSGTSYDFQVWPLGTRFKSRAAVCLFTKRKFSNQNFSAIASHECMHIGQTGDLSTLSYSSPHTKLCDCICVYLVDDAAQRTVVEQDLSASLGVWDSAFKVRLEPSVPKTAAETPEASPPQHVAVPSNSP